MMRSELEKLGNDNRYTFVGNFGGVGFKSAHVRGKDIYSPTLILTNVKHDNTVVTDHLWFNYGKQFTNLGLLRKGDKIKFNGRVSTYEKGRYMERKTDYKIERPTKVELLASDADKRQEIPNNTTMKNALIGMIMTINKAFYLKYGRPYEQYYLDKYKEWKKMKKID